MTHQNSSTVCSVQHSKAAWPSQLAREMTEMALRAVHAQDEASRQPLLTCCIIYHHLILYYFYLSSFALSSLFLEMAQLAQAES